MKDPYSLGMLENLIKEPEQKPADIKEQAIMNEPQQPSVSKLHNFKPISNSNNAAKPKQATTEQHYNQAATLNNSDLLAYVNSWLEQNVPIIIENYLKNKLK